MSHDNGRISSTPTASEPSKVFHSFDYAPYPKLDPTDVTPPPLSPSQPVSATTMPLESNPYVSPSPAPMRVDTMDTVKDSLGKWGKMAADPARRLSISPETFGSTVNSLLLRSDDQMNC